MALKATIFKVELSVSDLNRHYYAQHTLTLARHPSENDKRLMLRLIAFIDNASEQLSFTKGLSDTETPDLWLKNDVDEIEQWIELGQPSPQRIKKGCNQSREMKIYSANSNSFKQWFQKESSALSDKSNLNVITIEEDIAEQLGQLADRQMSISATLDSNEIYLTVNDQNIEVSLQKHQ